MSFHNVRLDDALIIYETEGGPEYDTEVKRAASGKEKRQINRDQALGSWEYGDREVLDTELDPLESFFHARKGKTYTFRFFDHGDYVVTAAQGRLGTGAVGTGLPTYDLWKRYFDAAGNSDRRIWLPYLVNVLRGGSPVAVGGGAGQISISTTLGQVTFVADATSAANSITPGATTSVVLASNPGTLSAGQRLYLTGFAGADAALVNGLAHTINSVTGAGPYTFVLATNTAGKTITLGSSEGRKYPQAAEALTWSGEHDKPVRFGTGKLTRRFLVKDGARRMFYVSSLPIVEVLDP